MLYSGGFGDFEACAGLGARFGVFFFRGLTPANDPSLEATSSSLLWVDPAALLGLYYRAAPQLRIVAAFEAGLIASARITVAPQNDLVALKHAWFGASLGLGLAF